MPLSLSASISASTSLRSIRHLLPQAVVALTVGNRRLFKDKVPWRLNRFCIHILSAAIEQVEYHLLTENPHVHRLAAGRLHRFQSIKRNSLQDAHILSVPVRISALKLLAYVRDGLR